MPLKIVHIINSLDTGGAETMLVRLLGRADRRRFTNAVITLRPAGALRPVLEQMGIAVDSLEVERRFSDWRCLARCAALLARHAPDCVQSWLYHADLAALVAGTLARTPAIIWGIRNAGAIDCPLTTKLLARVLALASRWPAAIVANSEAGRAAHAKLGYATRRMMVIPNGIDLDQFRPDPEARRGVRAELGIGPDAFLVGLFARYHPVKDHRTFLAAAARFASLAPEACFLLCGYGVSWENREFAALVPRELAGRVHLLGERREVARILAGLEVAASSSRSEGFPNAVGEAMACGVPCVATAAGDARWVVGDTGWVVPVGDPEAMAAGWQKLRALGGDGRRALGQRARRRVAEHFELSRMVQSYERLWTALGKGTAPSPTAEAETERRSVVPA